MNSEGINSVPYRSHRTEIERRSSIPISRKEFQKSLGRMFSDYTDGAPHDFTPEQMALTPEEEQDIRNFMEYAQKRLGAGAVSSAAYHKELARGDIETPLRDLAETLYGHEAMHAFVAWLRSDGKSLVPAYFAGREGYLDLPDHYLALVEEDYANFLSDLRSIRRQLMEVDNAPDPVQAAIEVWEEERSRRYHFKGSLEFIREHRLPQLESVVRNVFEDMQKKHPDPKINIHEFQRLAAPLLERLRNKALSLN